MSICRVCVAVGLWWSLHWCPAWCCTDVVKFSLKQETRFIWSLISPLCDLSNIHQNGSGLRDVFKGMIEVKSQQGILLAVISLACLCCVYAFCLCCKKRSKKVIRPNQVPSTSRKSTAMLISPTNNKIHCSYQNFPNRVGGIYEPTYVDPIPDFLYANEDDAEMDVGTYENVILTTEVQHDSDDSYDYENSGFLANRPEESEYANN